LYESDNGNIEFVPKKLRKSKRRSEDRNQQCIIALDQNCTHFGHISTQNEKIPHSDGLYRRQQHRRRLLFRDVKAIATEKFIAKSQGITYLDIIKLADDPNYTPKQAQHVLRNFKKDGKLYASYRTKPQQYFLSREDAENIHRLIHSKAAITTITIIKT
jgi:hypothetical protein